jgi:hypothetical protein
MSQLTRLVTIAALALTVGCTSTSDDDAQHEGLNLISVDDNGIEATFRSGDAVISMQSYVQGDEVVSTISADGKVLTTLTVPAGTDMDVGADLGMLVRDSAEQLAALETDVAYTNLYPIYDEALDAVFDATSKLDRSTVRFALVWHEEVLIRLLPADPNVDETSWDDALYTLDANADEYLHTNMIYAPHLAQYRAETDEALKCNLNCAWYDVCCQHDEACVNCNHWYCGPTCEVGCFGGDCGGGR